MTRFLEIGGTDIRIPIPDDPAMTRAERDFRRIIEQVFGGECLYDEWKGTGKPHHVACSAGHDTYPRPNTVQQGGGICRKCAGQDTDQAEKDFRRRVEQFGGECLYDNWEGTHKRHLVRCAARHVRYICPTWIQNGRGMCRVCAGKDTTQAEKEFKRRVEQFGGECLYKTWGGSSKRHLIRCAVGHESYPIPSHVQQGQGICRLCAGKVWDVFYVLTSDCTVKLGITSGSPRQRLSDHRADGFVNVLFTAANIQDVYQIEQAILHTLKSKGWRPVRGREYFNIDALPVILDELSKLGIESSS